MSAKVFGVPVPLNKNVQYTEMHLLTLLTIPYFQRISALGEIQVRVFPSTDQGTRW
jgi:hypothetical protein